MKQMTKAETLEHYFGYKTFREGQETIIDRLLSGNDAVGIMPTGAGKSICYQVPALMMEGITLVISPLISLMKDQVSALVQSGVSAAFINSTLTPRQSDLALSRAANGAYKIIYVAPERLTAPSFLDFAMNADSENRRIHPIAQETPRRRSIYGDGDKEGQGRHRGAVRACFAAGDGDRLRPSEPLL